jgi:hypothetical protein
VWVDDKDCAADDTLSAYTGKLQHAKWETFDDECSMDGMANLGD